MIAVFDRFSFNLLDTIYFSMILIELLEVTVIPSRLYPEIATKASSTYDVVRGSSHCRSSLGPSCRWLACRRSGRSAVYTAYRVHDPIEPWMTEHGGCGEEDDRKPSTSTD